MSNKIFNGIVRLRKDTEANYALVKTTFKPADGELCIVDCNGKIKFKVGNGTSTFEQLSYVEMGSETAAEIQSGYYFNNKFYADSTYTTELEKNTHFLYLDKNSNNTIYTYNGTSFDTSVTNATNVVAGIMKLYQTHGSNVDGSISQKVFTESIEGIQLAFDSAEEECLVLTKPWN